jgi:hypothetical protein
MEYYAYFTIPFAPKAVTPLLQKRSPMLFVSASSFVTVLQKIAPNPQHTLFSGE